MDKYFLFKYWRELNVPLNTCSDIVFNKHSVFSTLNLGHYPILVSFLHLVEDKGNES